MKMNTPSNYDTIKKRLVSQISIELSTNTFLFLSWVLILPPNHRTQPTDLATCHLALVHIVILPHHGTLNVDRWDTDIPK
jgi:hypothetical protein